MQLHQHVSSLSMQSDADVPRSLSEGELVQQLQQEVASLSAQKSAVASEFESKLAAGKPDFASEALVAQLKSSLASEQASKETALRARLTSGRSCNSRYRRCRCRRRLMCVVRCRRAS